jgi:hypothetical protein
VAEKSQKGTVDTLYLWLGEDRSLEEGRLELEEKLLYALSMVWVTTEQFMRRRWGEWEKREELFSKQASLFLLKEGHSVLSEDVSDKLEALFWTVAVFNPKEVGSRRKKLGPQLTVEMARKPYA